MNTEIELHQLCSMLPEMSEAELQEMAADMRKHGMLEPIVTLGGLVLDGRHRAMVCAMLGREPEFITWEDLVARGKSRTPAEYVLARNFESRHIGQKQKARLAFEVLESNTRWRGSKSHNNNA